MNKKTISLIKYVLPRLYLVPVLLYAIAHYYLTGGWIAKKIK